MTASPEWRGRKGQAFAKRIIARDLWTCQIVGCGTLLRSGKAYLEHPSLGVVDHIRPRDLRPDLMFDPANCRACCKSCHDGPMQRIETLHAGDADAIAKAKQAFRFQRVGLDGYST